MPSQLDAHRLPRLELRAPTAGPIIDPAVISRFIDESLRQTGVHEPTLLVVNLDGRFLSSAALLQLVIPLAQAIQGGTYGSLSLAINSSDPAVRDVISSLARTHNLSLFVSSSMDRLDAAEPAGPLTPTDRETLTTMRRIGGRATVSMMAKASGLDHTAVGNRLAGLDERHLLMRVSRPGREGHLYIDPRVAGLWEDPADPTSGDYGLSSSLRTDVQTLADMQGRQPDAVLLEAWKEFLAKHRDQLTAAHTDASRMVRDRDEHGLSEFAQRHAKKRARSEVKKRSA